MVDIILGLIFITAIVCFTVYKINKVNKLGGKKVKQAKETKEKRVLEEVQEKLEDILYENDMSSTKSQIGFKYNKSTGTLQKEKPEK